jgi:hypothetical protein
VRPSCVSISLPRPLDYWSGSRLLRFSAGFAGEGDGLTSSTPYAVNGLTSVRSCGECEDLLETSTLGALPQQGVSDPDNRQCQLPGCESEDGQPTTAASFSRDAPPQSLVSVVLVGDSRDEFSSPRPAGDRRNPPGPCLLLGRQAATGHRPDSRGR